jgi:hypothetical protein
LNPVSSGVFTLFPFIPVLLRFTGSCSASGDGLILIFLQEKYIPLLSIRKGLTYALQIADPGCWVLPKIFPP